MAESKILLHINGRTLTAALADNSSAAALRELLRRGPLTIKMSDYANMEKVGPLGCRLPSNDESMTVGPCDLILYLGSSFVIYYGSNSWSLTRLGRIEDITPEALRRLLGRGGVTVTLSLTEGE